MFAPAVYGSPRVEMEDCVESVIFDRMNRMPDE
jgi:hypothetical protein